MRRKEVGMIIVIAAIISSCGSPSASNDRNNYIRRDSFPHNPVNGQRYYNNGHSWFYDYTMMRWVMNGSNGGGNYYYYPSSGCYKNSSGVIVNNEQAYRGAHPGSFTNGKASTPTRSGVFGSKGHSISVHS
jgi:hypothetical protein